MKSIIIIFNLLLLIIGTQIKAQNCIIKEWNENNSLNDTLYIGNQPQQFLDSLNSIGYYTLEILRKNLDSCDFTVQKGRQYKKIFLSKGSIRNKLVKNESLTNQMYTMAFEEYIQSIKDSLANIGQPFSSIQIQPKGYFMNSAVIDVVVENRDERIINKIKFVGYDQIPRFINKHLLHTNLRYTPLNIAKIKQKIDGYNFLTQTQEPKISFTKDSTTLYIYVQKRKLSLFEGLIGFESDENGKFSLQGNIDINLFNNFNQAERINLSWQSGLNKSQNLEFAFHLPYILNTNFGINSSINLQKQDSSFVKLQMRNGLAYQFNSNHFVSANYNFASSNFVGERQDSQADFSKNGFGITYQYENSQYSKFKENKTYLTITSGIWNQKIKEDDTKIKQNEILYQLVRQQHLFKNHFTHLGLSGKNLIQKENILENDLYQLGGFNSLRGFNQNSILTSSYNLFSAAYRYIPNDQIFFEIFSDFALIKNRENIVNSLHSIGAGLQFLTKFGFFQLHYAIGYQENKGYDIANGKIHLGIKSLF